MTYREAIRKALATAMEENPDVVLIGEDLGIYGGCFKVTEGLWKNFSSQIFETPVSEETFTGLAVGASVLGMRPVVEIMYADFYSLITDPIVNHAAKMSFMNGGQFNCPLVVRLPEGSGTGHGPQHTQTPEAAFLGVAGLTIVAPSNPIDAESLLLQSIKNDGPVLFFENKMLYNLYEKDFFPINHKAVFGKTQKIRDGKDLTIVSYSQAVRACYKASLELDKVEISTDLFDLATLQPLDLEPIYQSIKKTGHLMVVQDSTAFSGISSIITAKACANTEVFNALKKPPAVLGGRNCPTPFSRRLEKTNIPQVKTICSVAQQLVSPANQCHQHPKDI